MLKVNWIYKVFNLTLALLVCFSSSLAQPALPQRFNTLRAIQPIHFGSFCITGGSGGTISVGYDGSRSATGDIVLLNVPPFAQPAIFEIKLGQSATVCFNYEPPYLQLIGGLSSIAFVVGPTNKGPNGALFATNANIVSQLRVGGTLTVMGSTPPGFYSGIFAISFSRQ